MGAYDLFEMRAFFENIAERPRLALLPHDGADIDKVHLATVASERMGGYVLT